MNNEDKWMKHINGIVDLLINEGLITKQSLELKRLNSGTTKGALYTLLIEKVPTYVVKIDDSKNISSTNTFLTNYKDVKLLPSIHYIDDKQEFIVYSYISGETHYNRGPKLDWMTVLIKELFIKYDKVEKDLPWGRIQGIPRKSWSEFNQASFESAQENIGNILPMSDHNKVKMLLNKLTTSYKQEEKYYLHGDTGVHNFIFFSNRLKGVIDPSPLIGPKVYDFTYAFCSSPDSLNLDTLFSLFPLWNSSKDFTEERILDEVLFQLYTRIGVCIKVHPHDLNEYLEAWKELRKYLPSI
ncbi:phosphotransferase [Cytobacillus gottheilii]|uniref:phosphotransferase n=1 Tax=Cytobacillus gottheilii TaxID=859144 RepID=UPI003CFB3531